jgi:hypothetical protein
MSTFRTRPVVVEAWRIPELGDESGEAPPLWVTDAITGTGSPLHHYREGQVFIDYMEMREQIAQPGDWLVRSPTHRIFALSDGEFCSMFEEVTSC